MRAEISEAEKAYRRGFDQAIALVLLANGAKNQQVQNLAYKQKVAAWRYGRRPFSLSKREDPPEMTRREAQEYRQILFNGYCMDLDEQADA